MRIKTKLLLGFFIISAVTAIKGYWVLFQLGEITKYFNVDIPLRIEQLSKTSEIDGLAQRIRYYDEILTQSARNYAFTENPRWKRRYYAFEPLLETVIKQALKECDEKNKDVFKQIEKSNNLLKGMEFYALECVQSENSPKAIETLE